MCLWAILSATSGPPITSTAQLLVYSSQRHRAHSKTTTQSRSHVVSNILFHYVYVVLCDLILLPPIHVQCNTIARFIASSTQKSRAFIATLLFFIISTQRCVALTCCAAVWDLRHVACAAEDWERSPPSLPAYCTRASCYLPWCCRLSCSPH